MNSRRLDYLNGSQTGSLKELFSLKLITPDYVTFSQFNAWQQYQTTETEQLTKNSERNNCRKFS